MKKAKYLIIIFFVSICTSCGLFEKSETEIINEWIWDIMTEVYLWAEDVSPSLQNDKAENSEEYFYSLVNENDRFSWIVDDYQDLVDMLNSKELTSGISPGFIKLSESDNVIVVVEYVSEGSPAEVAGIERGDIIYMINDEVLNTANYANLFYSEELNLQFADYNGTDIIPNQRNINITATVIESDPLLHSEIIEINNHKIGYLAYAQFTFGENNKWQESLDAAFNDFKSEAVDNVVIDIRYNPGGSISAATHLASLLMPEESLSSTTPFINFEWNELYQDYFIQEEGEDSQNLVVPFEETPSNNLDLNDVYFLTTSHSASASELIIVGLDPYMNITHIGETTYGKCYGSITIPDTEDPPRHNWAMQPIVIKYSNIDGFTDFHTGLIPDIFVGDNLLDAKAFGDPTDPMLAQAILEITGNPVEMKKTVQQRPEITILADPIRDKKSKAIFERK